MGLRRFDQVDAFFQAAGAFLAADEPRHNLELGILSQLRTRPGRYPDPPYLAALERDGRVCGVAMRTPPFGALVSLTDVADASAVAEDIRARYESLPSVLSTPETARAFAAAWSRLSGQRAVPGMRQQIYRLDEVPPEPDGPGRMRPATVDDRDLLLRWVEEFLVEAVPQQPRGRTAEVVDDRLRAEDAGLVLWEDPGPVAMAGFGGPTPTGIRIGPVYTPPDHRRHGYGTAATAALSRMLMLRGYRTCFLYTDLANPTSNGIYAAIGYRPVCEMLEVRFEGP